MTKQDFSGTWRSTYYYKHPGMPGLQSSWHEVKIHQQGDNLVIESLPNKEKSYLIMRLRLDGRLATGTWEEHTSPTGAHEREIYIGAVQFVLTEDGNFFDGMFLSVDKRNFVKNNHWEIQRK